MKNIILAFLFLCASNLAAQDIEVRSMKMVEASSEASARKDINGTTCALLRVQMKEEGAIFEGNIIGEVSFRNGEYWIYMPNGSKRLGIKHPDFLPITVIFSEFGIKKMESGSEYLMSTKTHKEKPKKESSKRGMVVFQLTPSSSKLIVDNAPVAAAPGGQYSMSLPYGTHYYTVQYGDFSISHQAVKIDKDPKAVNVDLTEFFAKLTVTCKEKDATIIINDELSGIESVEKMVTPGQYVIKVQKEGFHPLSQTVSLDDNECFIASFGEMKAMVGSLKIDYEPHGAEVYLDGEMIGRTPLKKENMAIGDYLLEIKKDYCNSLSRPITISEDHETNVNGKLEMSLKAVLLDEASKGDGCAMMILAFLTYNRVMGWGAATTPCYACFRIFREKAAGDMKDSDFFNQDLDLQERVKIAAHWYKRACSASFFSGMSDSEHEIKCQFCKNLAMLFLSDCYARLEDYSESFKWIQECSDKYGEDEKFINVLLAWHYYYGRGVTKDIDKAKSLLRQIIDPDDFPFYSIDEILKRYILDDNQYQYPLYKLQDDNAEAFPYLY